MRTFDTGATRDSDETKHDYDGFLSPIVLERFAEYMTQHRVQADGGLRASDNWQKGIPVDAYRKSLWRHFFDVWKMGRGYPTFDKTTGKLVTIEEALCAIMFNAMGWLHEHIKARAEAALRPTIGGRPLDGVRVDAVDLQSGPYRNGG